MTWRRWLVPAIVLAFLAGGTWLALRSSRAALDARAVPRTSRMVPESVRVKIVVLNATDTRGLARSAMLHLRDAGFDVVFFGNTPERADTSIVLDRSGHAEWAALAAKAMGRARVEQRPDSSHYLDLTVLVGRNWTPSREPLRP